MEPAPSLQLNSGYKIPQLAFGTANDSKEAVFRAVQIAIDAGFRHFDCALIYGVEKEVGLAIADGMKRHNLKREDFFVTSKLWCDKHAPEDVREACQLSLKNFGLDYLDLYLIHWPVSFHLKEGAEFDFNDPDVFVYEHHKLEDTWKAMEKLVEEGLVKSIGVSNFNKRQIDRIMAHGNLPPAVNQVEVNLHCLNTKLIDYCQSEGIQIEAYAPLGSTGPWMCEMEPLTRLKNVVDIAEKHNKSPAQVLLRHAFQRNLVVISKSVTPERIRTNYEILDFELRQEEVALLNESGLNRRLFEIPAFAMHPEYPFHDEY